MAGNDLELPSPNIGGSDGAISSTSSSSSFVPIDEHQILDAIQVINEDKQFNTNIMDYISKSTPSSVIGNNYHIISVFGSQSTGKSTLLNKLFNTNFDVMDEARRQQTTKGIWLAYSPNVNTTHSNQKIEAHENIFVMDVEGTDGRERGEDQDFERKAALFALSTSEVLIINIWETQIGLYQGANMGLLKTVFEVNLTLFGKSKLNDKSNHRVLLLFVIRDHLGVTSKENLAATVTQDLVKMWDNLSKPAELTSLEFSDFFDISFHTLGHKVLQPEKFIDDVRLLGDRVVDRNEKEYIFKPEYHHNIPIDGWTLYAANCWDQIDNNKDLDLPTQQILVAKFKCDEIANNVYEEFLLKFDHHLTESKAVKDTNVDFKELGLLFVDLRNDSLENYDISASRYISSVYESKRKLLDEQLVEKFKELFEVYNNVLVTANIKQFTTALSLGKKSLPGKNFQEGVSILKTKTLGGYSDNLRDLSLGGSILFDTHEQKFTEKLDDLIKKQQYIELNNVINKANKKVVSGLNKSIAFELNDLNDTTWDNVLSKFNLLNHESLAKYKNENGNFDFGLGTTEEINEEVVKRIKFKNWQKFYESIHKYISKETLVNLLQDRFDDKFRYDENGLPKLYQNSHELDTSFASAKTYALKVVDILTEAKLSSGKEIKPEYDIFDKKLAAKYGEDIKADEEEKVEITTYDSSDDEEAEEEEEVEGERFAVVLNKKDKAFVLNKFKKETDAKYVETKRSIIQHVTQIPYYIYLIIVVLGWNEFMAIIRNPIFFTLLVIIGAGTYVMYQLNLLKPAMVVAQRMVEESVDIGKQKLREFIIDDGPSVDDNARNLGKISGGGKREEEVIEMEDLGN